MASWLACTSAMAAGSGCQHHCGFQRHHQRSAAESLWLGGQGGGDVKWGHCHFEVGVRLLFSRRSHPPGGGGGCHGQAGYGSVNPPVGFGTGVVWWKVWCRVQNWVWVAGQIWMGFPGSSPPVSPGSPKPFVFTATPGGGRQWTAGWLVGFVPHGARPAAATFATLLLAASFLSAPLRRRVVAVHAIAVMLARGRPPPPFLLITIYHSVFIRN